MNNIEKYDKVGYYINFKTNKIKPIIKQIQNDCSHDKALKTVSASALAYGTALLSTNNKEENIDRIGDGFDNIYFINMGKEIISRKKEMEPLENLTKEEYDLLLPDVLNMEKDISKLNQDIIYPRCPYKYLGLLPYCGLYDSSLEINQYLSNRIVQGNLHRLFMKGNLNKCCSTLDYSLNELDKEFGKYEGIIYRIGAFLPNCSQFYSTSNKPLIDMYLDYLETVKNSNTENPENIKIHLIKTKNGHKICDFQKEYCEPTSKEYEEVRDDFVKENEILLDRHSRFQKSYEDQELQDEKLKIAKILFEVLKDKELSGWQTLEEITNKIEIWEEIS